MKRTVLTPDSSCHIEGLMNVLNFVVNSTFHGVPAAGIGLLVCMLAHGPFRHPRVHHPTRIHIDATGSLAIFYVLSSDR